MSEWKQLGSIVLTQIHTDRMIHDGVYHDELLAEVDALWLGPDGVVGVRGNESLLHGHHRLHPTRLVGATAKHRSYLPGRLLSFGFTGHYDAMAEHFGAAPVGCAAEDIVIECDQLIELSQVANGVQIRRGDRVVDLVDATVAKPCVAFTKYLLGDRHATDDRVAPHRAFLDHGMRGFLVGLANHIEPVDIRVGDEFWIKNV